MTEGYNNHNVTPYKYLKLVQLKIIYDRKTIVEKNYISCYKHSKQQ